MSEQSGSFGRLVFDGAAARIWKFCDSDRLPFSRWREFIRVDAAGTAYATNGKMLVKLKRAASRVRRAGFAQIELLVHASALRAAGKGRSQFSDVAASHSIDGNALAPDATDMPVGAMEAVKYTWSVDAPVTERDYVAVVVNARYLAELARFAAAVISERGVSKFRKSPRVVVFVPRNADTHPLRLRGSRSDYLDCVLMPMRWPVEWDQEEHEGDASVAATPKGN